MGRPNRPLPPQPTPKPRTVAILTNQILDWRNGQPTLGGGERYCLELCRLLASLGYSPTIYQPEPAKIVGRDYYGFPVEFLPRGLSQLGEWCFGACAEFTRRTASFDRLIYFLPEYSSGETRPGSIGINHGVHWDYANPGSQLRSTKWHEHLRQSVAGLTRVVCVDTNAISVMRALHPDLARKMSYVPNFVDTGRYPETPRDNRVPHIIVPRRVNRLRGSEIYPEIVRQISAPCTIEWVGGQVAVRDPRCSSRMVEFDDMPGVYLSADISIIPTLGAEGTSLSAIESLAAGCAVVATAVGGLPNVIHDGYNGLLVDPNSASIAAAVNRLLTDHELRERLQANARESAQGFDLAIWRGRWTEILRAEGWL